MPLREDVTATASLGRAPEGKAGWMQFYTSSLPYFISPFVKHPKNGIFLGGDSDFFDSGTFESRNDHITATIRIQNDNPLVPLTGRRKWRSSPELNERAVTWSKKTCY
jgi:hypothetical protein